MEHVILITVDGDRETKITIPSDATLIDVGSTIAHEGMTELRSAEDGSILSERTGSILKQIGAALGIFNTV